MFLISPTEPEPIRAMGTTSSLPELHGVDILWAMGETDGTGGAVFRAGVQRKAFPGDLIASLTDGRLARELQQMAVLDLRALLVEGNGSWTTDGALVHEHVRRPFALRHLRGILTSLQLEHQVLFLQSQDPADSVQAVRDLAAWLRRHSHVSLLARPKPKAGWGPKSAAWRAWFWQAIPGVGPETASRLAEKWVALPVQLLVDERALREVEGVGPGRAREIARYFGGGKDDVWGAR